MVDNLPVHDLLLIVLLWLGGLLYKKWARNRAAICPTPRKPATLLHKHSQNPKPFPGLTHKPRCALCEQAPAPTSPVPLVPPAPLLSLSGRPRQVDTSAQFCPQPHCAYYGWGGLGNIQANGYPNGGRWRQFQCLGCKTYFLETHGTPLHGKRVAPEVVVWVVGALAEGLGIRAGFCRKVASNTLLSTICGVFHVLSFQYVVWFVNFATERAACNGSTPTGASPVTVSTQT